ncbi:hypothetical protein EDC63_11388 [Sulfurirhabdus autotrophica]|uniref:Uncharacterized protein n=2 Tax=Sulfurirhabdus autotrophica TaxID=1706046 RepID=A0A4R3XYJ3_9PROT|nr:hypothetical protein EDC63_11388 [Sulfurirhabdus autotrophica]
MRLLKNAFHQSLPRLLIIYIALVCFISLLFPLIYSIVFPNTGAELVRLFQNAITAGFNMDNFKQALPGVLRDKTTLVAFIMLVLHAFAIIVLNMVFPAVIVAKFIRPNVDIRISSGATYNPQYGLTKSPHVLFRIINANPFDLYAITLRAFLTIHDENTEDKSKEMIYYFPVKKMDPQEIPVLKSHSPWVVAIPVDEKFENSIIQDYELAITQNSGSHKGLRKVELLISGNEINSGSTFMTAVSINLEKEGKDGIICGRFESLPAILKKLDLNKINIRIPTENDTQEETCHTCTYFHNCKFLPLANV